MNMKRKGTGWRRAKRREKGDKEEGGKSVIFMGERRGVGGVDKKKR